MATKWSKYDKWWLCFSILLIILASFYKFLFIVDETSNLIIEVISSVLAVFGVTYVFEKKDSCYQEPPPPPPEPPPEEPPPEKSLPLEKLSDPPL